MYPLRAEHKRQADGLSMLVVSMEVSSIITTSTVASMAKWAVP